MGRIGSGVVSLTAALAAARLDDERDLPSRLTRRELRDRVGERAPPELFVHLREMDGGRDATRHDVGGGGGVRRSEEKPESRGDEREASKEKKKRARARARLPSRDVRPSVRHGSCFGGVFASSKNCSAVFLCYGCNPRRGVLTDVARSIAGRAARRGAA